MPTLTIGHDDFLLDGEPHRILSGALHYFRVHPDHWADRIDKARRLGLNTIETYVAWNAHAPSPAEWRADGGLDLDRFLRLVHEAGMHAIVRPGPYICAEWDNGGLPAWLTADPEVGVRRHEPRYLAAVGDFLDRVLAVVAPHQVDRGGPVVLVQVENEYGAYGRETRYLEWLRDRTRAAGITVPLVTVDQPRDDHLSGGCVDGVHLTASFGSRSTERLGTLRKHQPTGPLMCMEFWDGWFDAWGAPHHSPDVERLARDLDDLLTAGASVNLYMFHGGTNSGFTNGANDHGVYQPLVTSYDYAAPLDESGWPTPMYDAFRAVIARHAPVPDEPVGERPPAPVVAAPLGDPVALLGSPDAFGAATTWTSVPVLDDLGPQVRLALFSTWLTAGPGPVVLDLGEVRDRVQVFLDGDPVGVLARDHHDSRLVLPRGTGDLALVVEDQGRVNYGPRLGEAKGLVDGVRVDGVVVTDWQVRPLDLSLVPSVWAGASDRAAGPAGPVVGPVALRGTLDLAEPADLFLDTADWGKGVAWVNGHCLGRYWRRGPQRTLYVPAPVTRVGGNEVVVLELHAPGTEVRTLAAPDLGPTGG